MTSKDSSKRIITSIPLILLITLSFNYIYILIITLLIVILIFLVDRISKIKIINQTNTNNIYINDFINFDLVWNTGIGFGIFSTNSTSVSYTHLRAHETR